MSPAYGEALYWDERYRKDPQTFDWYQKYSDLGPLFKEYFQKDSRILMVGCGNASLSEDMAKDGYNDIWNVDISAVVIGSMRSKFADVEQLKYLQMDVRQLAFEDGSFDTIIDKGTLDSMMCGDSAAADAPAMLREITRVLAPGGVFIMITYGEPSVRLPHLMQDEYHWHPVVHILPRPNVEGVTPEQLQQALEPVKVDDEVRIESKLPWADGDVHYIYVCRKIMGHLTAGDDA